MCYNAVDRHVDEGNGEMTAVIWDSPITGNREQWTYSRLQKEVSRFTCHNDRDSYRNVCYRCPVWQPPWQGKGSALETGCSSTCL